MGETPEAKAHRQRQLRSKAKNRETPGDDGEGVLQIFVGSMTYCPKNS